MIDILLREGSRIFCRTAKIFIMGMFQVISSRLIYMLPNSFAPKPSALMPQEHIKLAWDYFWKIYFLSPGASRATGQCVTRVQGKSQNPQNDDTWLHIDSCSCLNNQNGLLAMASWQCFSKLFCKMGQIFLSPRRSVINYHMLLQFKLSAINIISVPLCN